MYSYNLEQWIIFFFIYCFLGWLWECCYVRLVDKEWVNRGFMHGPCLPIYGSGAIVILFLTLPVRDNYLLVYILGMLGATLLEYFTGMAMEKLFHVRYWDYSDMPLNLNGHICFFYSLGWGVFSLLLVEWIHKPIERMVLGIPQTMVDIMAFVVTVAAVADFTQSFNEAMDLREFLDKLTEKKEHLLELEKRMERRADVVAAVIDDDVRQFQKKKNAKMEQIREHIVQQKELMFDNNHRYSKTVKLLKRNPSTVSKEFSEALKEMKKTIRSHGSTPGKNP